MLMEDVLLADLPKNYDLPPPHETEWLWSILDHMVREGGG